MKDDKQQAAAAQIRLVTYIGAAINAGLSVLKVVIGVLVSSLSLVADGLHSLSDLATDAAVLLGLRLGSKRPDRCHPYGHGRIETFSAGIVALVLIVVGAAMVYYATAAIADNKPATPNIAVLFVAAISIVAKEWLYRMTRKAAIRSHSAALYANAWHHRSDALSSVAVIIGFIALELGFEHGDQLAAIAVGLMIIWVGVKIINDSLRELTEGSVDPETISRVEEIINADGAIRHWHQLRTRTVGRELFLDVHILVDPQLNVAAAHEIAEGLERTLDEQITRPVNITVHIEPDIPSLRRQ